METRIVNRRDHSIRRSGARLADLEVDGRRLAGIIIGRALYEGTVDLAAAVEAMGGR